MAIDATVGGAASNSFVTEEEAYLYLSKRPNGSAWNTSTDLDPASHEGRLFAAALRIGQERFAGRKSDSTQALAWPRSGVYDEDGCALDDDVIPAAIKYAQMELAFSMLTDDTLSDTGLEGFEHLKIGSIEITPRHRTAGALPAHVRRFLAPWLDSSPLGFRMLRG